MSSYPHEAGRGTGVGGRFRRTARPGCARWRVLRGTQLPAGSLVPAGAVARRAADCVTTPRLRGARSTLGRFGRAEPTSASVEVDDR